MQAIFIFVISLFGMTQVSAGNTGTVELDDLRKWSKHAEVSISCALSQSSEIQDFVQLDKQTVLKIDQLRVELNREVLHSESSTEHAKIFDSFSEKVQSLLTEDQRLRFNVVVSEAVLIAVCGDSEANWRLCKPLIASVVAKDREATDELAKPTANLVKAFRSFEKESFINAIEQSIESLTDSQKRAYRKLVGDVNGHRVRTVKLDSLEESYIYCACEAVHAVRFGKTSFVNELDLVDSQVKALHAAGNLEGNADVVLAAEQMFKIEAELHDQEGQLSEDERAELLKQRDAIELSIEMAGVKTVESILHPHQVDAIRQIAARTYLKMSDANPLRWPLHLQKELKISSSQMSKIESGVGKLDKLYRDALKAKLDSLASELEKKIPMSLLSVVNGISNDPDKPSVCKSSMSYGPRNVVAEVRNNEVSP